MICRTCQREREKSAFNTNRFRPTGLDADCRQCETRFRYQLATLDKLVRKKPTAEYVVRKAAQSAVQYCVRKGWIVRPRKCSWCESGRFICAHHEDYARPLDIIWLCRSCHKRLHHARNE